ncbi:protein-methionine-sulfoxide reductase heme-binding subunit MsrQ [Gluconacetobacter takamatsuzukensis]|uniref:Protein-methionine-sulfoxide reductase heme-binding subunit MsrQ n=1 Tax=Gluconacetobacter takamatsuzukensis TaxID=1286190 RepID=A0A7W4PS85_9PROT|nr:protein-methionine-sulfoxide reductase heme-binding subunit MsrQ [Gluconacetobacter takamatsuzukensis]MBB2204671.1 protein-methionine-sulfoxide reductase heme-binding subunit MsrQ [Gluconacetobacter takamatsuzukensis]
MASRRVRSAGLVRLALYGIGLVPAAVSFVQGATDRLGADPVNVFERTLGLWALRFLILSLCIAPLRDLAGINLLRYRRALGLLAFWYALFHLTAYVALDLGFDLRTLLADVTRRPFIILGMAAFTILAALAATSNGWAIRRLGRRWQALHRWVYAAAICAAIHFVLSFKVIRVETLLYGLVVAALLAFRVWRTAARRGRRRPASAAGRDGGREFPRDDAGEA